MSQQVTEPDMCLHDLTMMPDDLLPGFGCPVHAVSIVFKLQPWAHQLAEVKISRSTKFDAATSSVLGQRVSLPGRWFFYSFCL